MGCLVRHRPPWVVVVISVVEAVAIAIGNATAIAMQMPIPVGIHMVAIHAVAVIADWAIPIRHAARKTSYDAHGKK